MNNVLSSQYQNGNGVENGEMTISFKWKATIKRKLKENGGEVS